MEFVAVVEVVGVDDEVGLFLDAPESASQPPAGRVRRDHNCASRRVDGEVLAVVERAEAVERGVHVVDGKRLGGGGGRGRVCSGGRGLTSFFPFLSHRRRRPCFRSVVVAGHANLLCAGPPLARDERVVKVHFAHALNGQRAVNRCVEAELGDGVGKCAEVLEARVRQQHEVHFRRDLAQRLERFHVERL